MVGTEEFVSPEMLNDFECGIEADLWALGIITYQMLAGKTPFKGYNRSETFDNILEHKYKFPASFTETTRDFIS